MVHVGSHKSQACKKMFAPRKYNKYRRDREVECTEDVTGGGLANGRTGGIERLSVQRTDQAGAG